MSALSNPSFSPSHDENSPMCRQRKQETTSNYIVELIRLEHARHFPCSLENPFSWQITPAVQALNAPIRGIEYKKKMRGSPSLTKPLPACLSVCQDRVHHRYSNYISICCGQSQLHANSTSTKLLETIFTSKSSYNIKEYLFNASDLYILLIIY